jgi:hypothetical protein
MRDDVGLPLIEHILNGKWNSSLVRAAAERLTTIQIDYRSLDEDEYHNLILLFAVSFFARGQWPYKHDSNETTSLEVFVRNLLNAYDRKAISGATRK